MFPLTGSVVLSKAKKLTLRSSPMSPTATFSCSTSIGCMALVMGSVSHVAFSTEPRSGGGEVSSSREIALKTVAKV